MKNPIELNGIANLSLLIANMKENLGNSDRNGWDDAALVVSMAHIEEQLELTERYLIAYARAVSENSRIPLWHEVRDNPTAYPLHRELHNVR